MFHVEHRPRLGGSRLMCIGRWPRRLPVDVVPPPTGAAETYPHRRFGGAAQSRPARAGANHRWFHVEHRSRTGAIHPDDVLPAVGSDPGLGHGAERRARSQLAAAGSRDGSRPGSIETALAPPPRVLMPPFDIARHHRGRPAFHVEHWAGGLAPWYPTIGWAESDRNGGAHMRCPPGPPGLGLRPNVPRGTSGARVKAGQCSTWNISARMKAGQCSTWNTNAARAGALSERAAEVGAPAQCPQSDVAREHGQGDQSGHMRSPDVPRGTLPVTSNKTRSDNMFHVEPQDCAPLAQRGTARPTLGMILLAVWSCGPLPCPAHPECAPTLHSQRT